MLLLSRITLVALPLFAAACGLVGSENTNCDTNPAFAWKASPPPSAADLEERCAMNIVNPSYTASFSMSPDDLEAFQQSTPIRAWTTDASAAVVFENEAAQMESFLIGTYSDGAVALEVLIDTSDPQEYRVFYDAAYVD
jgi:hypothetical protein